MQTSRIRCFQNWRIALLAGLAVAPLAHPAVSIIGQVVDLNGRPIATAVRPGMA